MVPAISSSVFSSSFNSRSSSKQQVLNKQEPTKQKTGIHTKEVCAACFVAGAALTGSAIYLAKHGGALSIPLCTRLLPRNTITDSFPDELKSLLTKKKNYNELIKFMNSPSEEFLHGTGANSSVYRLPFTDKYVMKVLNQNAKNDFRIGSLGSRNFGQPIWENPENNRILILRKIDGEPHSSANWSSIIWDHAEQAPKQVTVEQAESYFDSIIGISGMKQSAFDDLADQIKFLDTVPKFEHDSYRGFKVDSINPNNLMVDFEKGKLSIIDFFPKDKPNHQNSYMDMVAVISDFALLPEYFDLLPKNKQTSLIRALQAIDKKSFIAAEKVGLTTSKNVFTSYIDETSKYFPVPSVSNFDGSIEYVRSYDKTARNLLNLLDDTPIIQEL